MPQCGNIGTGAANLAGNHSDCICCHSVIGPSLPAACCCRRKRGHSGRKVHSLLVPSCTSLEGHVIQVAGCDQHMSTSARKHIDGEKVHASFEDVALSIQCSDSCSEGLRQQHTAARAAIVDMRCESG
jgi:hypothetical protein